MCCLTNAFGDPNSDMETELDGSGGTSSEDDDGCPGETVVVFFVFLLTLTGGWVRCYCKEQKSCL